jgi:hypothetical protein
MLSWLPTINGVSLYICCVKGGEVEGRKRPQHISHYIQNFHDGMNLPFTFTDNVLKINH